MTIGKRLVELHEGSISAASNGRNFGSTFTIRLPLNGRKDPAAGTHANGSPVTASHPAPIRKILLVEDHEPTKNALAKLLIRRHHRVQTAGSISEALACAAANHFDLVISDIGLPDGNGGDLFLKLKADNPHLKGIALTGFGMEEDVSRSAKSGFDVHLTKPVSIGSLETVLARIG